MSYYRYSFIFMLVFIVVGGFGCAQKSPILKFHVNIESKDGIPQKKAREIVLNYLLSSGDEFYYDKVISISVFKCEMIDESSIDAVTLNIFKKGYGEFYECDYVIGYDPNSYCVASVRVLEDCNGKCEYRFSESSELCE